MVWRSGGHGCPDGWSGGAGPALRQASRDRRAGSASTAVRRGTWGSTGTFSPWLLHGRQGGGRRLLHGREVRGRRRRRHRAHVGRAGVGGLLAPAAAARRGGCGGRCGRWGARVGGVGFVHGRPAVPGEAGRRAPAPSIPATGLTRRRLPASPVAGFAVFVGVSTGGAGVAVTPRARAIDAGEDCQVNSRQRTPAHLGAACRRGRGSSSGWLSGSTWSASPQRFWSWLSCHPKSRRQASRGRSSRSWRDPSIRPRSYTGAPARWAAPGRQSAGRRPPRRLRPGA